MKNTKILGEIVLNIYKYALFMMRCIFKYDSKLCLASEQLGLTVNTQKQHLSTGVKNSDLCSLFISWYIIYFVV